MDPKQSFVHSANYPDRSWYEQFAKMGRFFTQLALLPSLLDEIAKGDFSQSFRELFELVFQISSDNARLLDFVEQTGQLRARIWDLNDGSRRLLEGHVFSESLIEKLLSENTFLDDIERFDTEELSSLSILTQQLGSPLFSIPASFGEKGILLLFTGDLAFVEEGERLSFLAMVGRFLAAALWQRSIGPIRDSFENASFQESSVAPSQEEFVLLERRLENAERRARDKSKKIEHLIEECEKFRFEKEEAEKRFEQLLVKAEKMRRYLLDLQAENDLVLSEEVANWIEEPMEVHLNVQHGETDVAATIHEAPVVKMEGHFSEFLLPIDEPEPIEENREFTELPLVEDVLPSEFKFDEELDKKKASKGDLPSLRFDALPEDEEKEDREESSQKFSFFPSSSDMLSAEGEELSLKIEKKLGITDSSDTLSGEVLQEEEKVTSVEEEVSEELSSTEEDEQDSVSSDSLDELDIAEPEIFPSSEALPPPPFLTANQMSEDTSEENDEEGEEDDDLEIDEPSFSLAKEEVLHDSQEIEVLSEEYLSDDEIIEVVDCEEDEDCEEELLEEEQELSDFADDMEEMESLSNDVLQEETTYIVEVDETQTQRFLLFYFEGAGALPSSLEEFFGQFEADGIFVQRVMTEEKLLNKLSDAHFIGIFLALQEPSKTRNLIQAIHDSERNSELPIWEYLEMDGVPSLRLHYDEFRTNFQEVTLWAQWLRDIRSSQADSLLVLGMGFEVEQVDLTPLIRFCAGRQYELLLADDPAHGIQLLYQRPPDLLLVQPDKLQEHWIPLLSEISRSARTQRVPIIIMSRTVLDEKLLDVLQSLNCIYLEYA